MRRRGDWREAPQHLHARHLQPPAAAAASCRRTCSSLKFCWYFP
jgi:hypothetical protein